MQKTIVQARVILSNLDFCAKIINIGHFQKILFAQFKYFLVNPVWKSPKVIFMNFKTPLFNKKHPLPFWNWSERICPFGYQFGCTVLWPTAAVSQLIHVMNTLKFWHIKVYHGFQFVAQDHLSNHWKYVILSYEQVSVSSGIGRGQKGQNVKCL